MSEYERLILAANPAGYWPLGERSGTTAKAYGSTVLDGTYTACTVGVEPAPGGGTCPHFQSTSAKVAIVDDNAWSPQAGASGLITTECWAKPDAAMIGTGGMLICKYGGYEYALQSNADNSVSLFVLNTSVAVIGETKTPANTLVPGRWFHFCGTFDKAANVMEMYLNGRRVGGPNTISGTSSNGTAQLRLGNRGDNDAGGWIGRIAHCAIYPRVLPSYEIRQHFLAGLARFNRPVGGARTGLRSRRAA